MIMTCPCTSGCSCSPNKMVVFLGHYQYRHTDGTTFSEIDHSESYDSPHSHLHSAVQLQPYSQSMTKVPVIVVVEQMVLLQRVPKSMTIP